MVRRLLVTILVAFFIFPSCSFAGESLSGEGVGKYIESCIRQHKTQAEFCTTDIKPDCNGLMDTGLCQIRTNRKGEKVFVEIEYAATKSETDKYFSTLDYMKRKTQDMSDTEKIRFINDFFQKNVTYGGGDEAVDAISRGKAVCGGYAMAFQMIAEEVGLDSRVIVGESKGELHSWNEVVVNGVTYGVDTCWGEVLTNPNGWAEHDKLFEREL